MLVPRLFCVVAVAVLGVVFASAQTTLPPLRPDPSLTILRPPPDTTNLTLPPTAQQLLSLFDADEFVFDLAGSPPLQPVGVGGSIRPLSVQQLPSLAGQGIAYTLFTIDPCGVNEPHLHPRATEFIYVVSGSNLVTGFVQENGGDPPVLNTIGAGQATFFPEGLIHFQTNMGCEPAVYLSALGDEDPGVLTVSNQLFALPNAAVASTLGLSAEATAAINASITIGPVLLQQQQQQQCLDACAAVTDATGASSGLVPPLVGVVAALLALLVAAM